jgi:hypothetical protein
MDRVVEVVPLPNYRLRVVFDDGTTGTISLEEQLFGPMFEPLKEVAFFEQVSIDKFGAICWPNGADLAPDAIYDDLRSARDEQSPSPTSRG